MTALVMVFAIAGTCGPVAEVHAQDESRNDTNARLLACDTIADTMEKLACFDAVVKGLDPAPVAPSAAVPAAAAVTAGVAAASGADTPAATDAAPATPDAAPAASAAANAAPSTAPAADTTSSTVAAAATAAVATSGVTESEPAAMETSAAATSSAAMSVGEAATPEEMFGLEDVKVEEARSEKVKKQDALKSIQATVVRSWVTIDNRFETLLDNGQVWRETSKTRTIRLPKEGTSVVISKGRFGSFKMKLGNDNRLAGVRRTK